MDKNTGNTFTNDYFGRRIVAFAIDLLLVSIPVVFTNIFLQKFDSEARYSFLRSLVQIICYGYYFIKDTVFAEGSLGKKFMGLKLVDSNDVSAKVPFYKRVVRNLSSPLWIVEAIVVFVSDCHRRITDRLLHIDVVEKY